jgi:hypothetical protein
MDFKPGDVLIHKATLKRCVVKDIDSDGGIVVTTQDDQMRVYRPEELKHRESIKAQDF